MGKVLNLHHSGGPDKLPSGCVSIMRPGPWGNPYSSKTGKYTREESVALHRVHLYKTLIEDKTYFDTLKSELFQKDLGCVCKSDKVFRWCHGDNYIHTLSGEAYNRIYDKSVTYYLMEDLKSAIGKIKHRISQDVSQEDWLVSYLGFQDTRLEITYALYLCEIRELNSYDICVFISYLLMDLEAACQIEDVKLFDYRITHAGWRAHILFEIHPFGEPISPDSIKITKPKKKNI